VSPRTETRAHSCSLQNDDEHICSIAQGCIPPVRQHDSVVYGHSHSPRVALVPLLLKLGLCVCIKPAKSVSRNCKSASSRLSSSQWPCRCRACSRQAALLLHHTFRRQRSLRPCCFEPTKRLRLALQPSPGLALVDILGNQISLDRCLQSVPLCCGCHHRSLRNSRCFRQPTDQLSPFLAARARIRPASTRAPLQLVKTVENPQCLCPCSFEEPSPARQIAHGQRPSF
jgi:hypothetical protein